MKLTTKNYWDGYWSGLSKKRVETVIYSDILYRYLPKTKKTFLETGCVPGNYMIYFNKIFKYKVYGIDYSEKIRFTKNNLDYNRVKDYKLYKSDFFKWSPRIQFDVVCSFGFI